MICGGSGSHPHPIYSLYITRYQKSLQVQIYQLLYSYTYESQIELVYISDETLLKSVLKHYGIVFRDISATTW